MPRPTHFVALKVGGKEVQQAIRQVHAALKQADDQWGRALVSPRKAHITVQVLCLEGDAAIERVVEGLRAVANRARSLTVRLHGLDTFPGGHVLYMGVQDGGGDLCCLAGAIRAELTRQGHKAGLPFTPHVTVAKFGNVGQRIKPFDVDSLMLDDVYIPPVQLKSLLLCKMSSTAEDGFYEVVAGVPL